MIYLLLGVASSVVAVVALPLLLPQPKPPPEAYKSPGPPKLAIKSYMLGSYMLGPVPNWHPSIVGMKPVCFTPYSISILFLRSGAEHIIPKHITFYS